MKMGVGVFWGVCVFLRDYGIACLLHVALIHSNLPPQLVTVIPF